MREMRWVGLIAKCSSLPTFAYLLCTYMWGLVTSTVMRCDCGGLYDTLDISIFFSFFSPNPMALFQV